MTLIGWFAAFWAAIGAGGVGARGPFFECMTSLHFQIFAITVYYCPPRVVGALGLGMMKWWRECGYEACTMFISGLARTFVLFWVD